MAEATNVEELPKALKNKIIRGFYDADQNLINIMKFIFDFVSECKEGSSCSMPNPTMPPIEKPKDDDVEGEEKDNEKKDEEEDSNLENTEEKDEEEDGEGKGKEDEEEEKEDESEGEGGDDLDRDPDSVREEAKDNPYIGVNPEIVRSAERDLERASNPTGTPENTVFLLNNLLYSDNYTSGIVIAALLNKIKDFGIAFDLRTKEKKTVATILTEKESSLVNREQNPAPAINLEQVRSMDSEDDLIQDTIRGISKTPRKASIANIALVGLDTSGSMSPYIINAANRYIESRTSNPGVQKTDNIGVIFKEWAKQISRDEALDKFFDYENAYGDLLRKMSEEIKQKINSEAARSESKTQALIRMIDGFLDRLVQNVRVNRDKFLGNLCGSIYGNIDILISQISHFAGIVHASEYNNMAALTVPPFFVGNNQIQIRVKGNPSNFTGLDFAGLSAIQGAGNDNLYIVGAIYGLVARRIVLTSLLFYNYKKKNKEPVLLDFIFNTLHITDFEYDPASGFVKGFLDALLEGKQGLQRNTEAEYLDILMQLVEKESGAKVKMLSRHLTHYMASYSDFKNFYEQNKSKLQNADRYFKIVYQPSNKKDAFTYLYENEVIGFGKVGLGVCTFIGVNSRDEVINTAYFSTMRGIKEFLSEFISKNKNEMKNSKDHNSLKHVFYALLPYEVNFYNFNQNTIKILVALVKFFFLRAIYEKMKATGRNPVGDPNEILQDMADVLKIHNQEILSKTFEELKNFLDDTYNITGDLSSSSLSSHLKTLKDFKYRSSTISKTIMSAKNIEELLSDLENIDMERAYNRNDKMQYEIPTTPYFTYPNM